MNWVGMPSLSRRLLDAYVADRLHEMCDAGWPEAAAAIALDLEAGSCRTAPVFDLADDGTIDPESMRYLIVVPVDDKWYPWLSVHHSRLEIPPGVVRMEFEAALIKHGTNVCPDDASELDT